MSSGHLDVVIFVMLSVFLSVEICLAVHTLSERVTDIVDNSVKYMGLVGSSSVCVSDVLMVSASSV